MSQSILLSLVGEQTIPVVQLIRALPELTEYWFVETARTRELKAVENICLACKLPRKKVRTALVNPEALTFNPPVDWHISEDAALYLNLTSGTKPMMLSVYRAYEALPLAQPYYIPIDGKAALAVSGNGAPVTLAELNLETYLTACGFGYQHLTPDVRLQQKATALFAEILEKGSSAQVAKIQKAKAPDYSGTDKKWLCGEWWEDYLYTAIKKSLALADGQIAQGVQLEHCLSGAKTEADSELDVVFVYQNRLYVVEGKVYDQPATGKKVTDPIYKLGTLLKNMGLQATGIVAFCANITPVADQQVRIDYLKKLSGVKGFLTLKDFRKGDSVYKSIVK